MLVRDQPNSHVNHNSNLQHLSPRCDCQIERDPEGYLRPDDGLKEYGDKRLQLHTAALSGHWKTAENILEGNAAFVNSSVTEEDQTALHVAAGANQTDFVKKLVNWRPNQINLKLQDENGNTAFCLAVIAGNVPIARILLRKAPKLAVIRGAKNSIPLFLAAIFGHHDMAQLLFEKTKEHLNHLEPEDVLETFFTCIQTDMFDLALELLNGNDDLAVARNTDERTALHMLAGKTSTTFDTKRSGIVKMLINSCKESEDNKALELLKKLWKLFLYKNKFNVKQEIRRPFNPLFEAAKLGSSEYLAVLIRSYPELAWETDRENKTIFHIAVKHRQVNVFNLIYSVGSLKEVVVAYEIARHISGVFDNILHLTAELPSAHELNVVSGAALQMQRELLWFQVVENMIKPSDREAKGLKGKTPKELFSETHKDLLVKGENWMRGTSESCMLVATFIAAAVYAAGFNTTISNNDKGLPVHTLFHVLNVSEAVALSFSIISTLMFLYILTSRYAENDFLKSLPFKLMLGLTTLFISMMAMIVAFSSACFIAYMDPYHHRKSRWVPFLVSGFVCFSAAFFLLLRSLLRDIFHSTFCSRSLFRPKKSVFLD
ncbi:hypothetical protein PTKIN_Ptkin14bG0079000 [Pterospermum kingtungense]